MSSAYRLARKTCPAVLVLILLSAAMLLPGLGSSIVKRQQEIRVLLSARDMAEGGSWLIPHFMGEERLRKPPLMYWLVAGAFNVAGTAESETAGRLPSAMAGAALVLATYLCGRKLLGRRAAFLGSIVLMTCVGFMYHARLAETDVTQSLFCSLAAFAMYFALTSRTGGFRWWVLAGVFSGIGFLVKGPASIVMPVAASVVFALASRSPRTRGAIAPGKASILRGCVAALILFAAIAAPWYVAVALKTAGTDAQAGDELARLVSESAHKGPFVYYVWTLPARMGLWALALPVGIFAAWKKLRHHAGPRFILCWLASTFVILSLINSKQNHYAILLFVPSALLVGWLLNRASRRFPTIGKTTSPGFQSLETSKTRRDFYAGFAHWHLVVTTLLVFVIGLVLLLLWLRSIPISWPRELGLAGLLILSGALVALWALVVRRSVVPAMLVVALTLAYATGFHARKLALITDGDSAIRDFVVLNRRLIEVAPHFKVVSPHASMIAWYAHRLPVDCKVSPAEAWNGLGPGDVLLCSSRKRPLDVSSVPATPLARRGYMDVHACLFQKPAESPP